MDPSSSIRRRENLFLSMHLQKFRTIVPLFLCYELTHFSVKYLSLLYFLFMSSLFYFAILFYGKIVRLKFLCFRFSKDFWLVDWLVSNIFHEEYVVISKAVYFEILETWILFPFGFTKILRWLISWFEIFRNFLSSQLSTLKFLYLASFLFENHVISKFLKI